MCGKILINTFHVIRIFIYNSTILNFAILLCKTYTLHKFVYIFIFIILHYILLYEYIFMNNPIHFKGKYLVT